MGASGLAAGENEREDASKGLLAVKPLIQPQQHARRQSVRQWTVAKSCSAKATAQGLFLECYIPVCQQRLPSLTGVKLAGLVTLLQLNRHLDDVHRNLEDEQQVEVKDWFQTQVDKAKRFQPLAVLNQKLKGLEVFESNYNTQPLPPSARPTAESSVSESPKPIDADDLITKSHWQQRSGHDVCLEPMCEKRLTVTNGCINCRKCGRLFCEDHTMYQMKLSRSAQHEPVRGFWCRVCETCYKSREGYIDFTGAERDHSETFKALRKPTVDKAFLEISSLKDGLSVGRTIKRKCLSNLSLVGKMTRRFQTVRFVSKSSLRISFEDTIAERVGGLDPENPPEPAQLTEASKVRKRLMDSFAQYDVAARRIRDHPTQSPTQTKLQQAIYRQATGFLHLHMLPLKTLPKILKHATPHGRHFNSFDSSSSDGRRINGGAGSAQPRSLAAIKYGNPEQGGSSTSLASNNSSAISALEAEEKELRDRLIVLEEQRFFVSEMIADANKRRKFDEASSLAQNVADLNKEIDHVNGMISQLDFEGLFTGDAS
ncbi:vacuolar segregation protein [Arthroderma uncinatum]|uniref:vacuolar segregation protein n=1 Tax=Arthroderma uncinatum TaxID=74035 RepID=UPI00144AC797|nr:vacuolar segregation protein [Arthroderma uncinatum]KAF3491023.1 vacuolar segregation protein [Arthroderma uncinatum]